MSIRCVLFDIDGTLADTLPVCVAAFQVTLKEMTGIEYAPPQIYQYFGIAERGIFQQMVKPQILPETLQTYYRTYAQLHRQTCALFPGLLALIQELKTRELKLGVVTGRGAHGARLTVELLGVSPYFEVVEHGSDDIPGKLDALQRALTALDAQPQETVYIGDTAGDMEDAAALGLWAAGAAWASTASLHSNGWGERAQVFLSVADLSEWLLNVTAIAQA